MTSSSWSAAGEGARGVEPSPRKSSPCGLPPRRSDGPWPTTPREGPPQRTRARVLPEDAVHAADLSLWIEPLEEEEWPRRELRLGFDTQARLLVIVVLIFQSGESVRVHSCGPVCRAR